MSTTDTTVAAFALVFASIIPMLGMLSFLDRRPVFAWFCEGLFIIMAGSGIVWLLLVFYVNVVIY